MNEQSQYIRVVDLFQTRFVDDPDRDLPPVPALAPNLVTRANHVTEGQGGNPDVTDYRVPIGARFQFAWSDPGSGRHSDPEEPPEVRFEDAALADATIEGDHAIFTAAELGDVIDTALGGDFGVVVEDTTVRIGPAVATPAYLSVAAQDDNTFDLAAIDNLRFTSADADGANSQDFDIAINHNADDNLSADALATRLEAALAPDNPHGVTVESAGRYLVLRRARAAGVELSVVATDGGGPVDPWPPVAPGEPPPLVEVAGAVGFDDVDSYNDVTVSVSEVIQPGLDRVLAEIIPIARATGLDENHPANPILRPATTDDVPLRLVGGTDGQGLVGAAEFRGAETPQGRTGLRAFDIADINMLVMPGRNSAGLPRGRHDLLRSQRRVLRG